MKDLKDIEIKNSKLRTFLLFTRCARGVLKYIDAMLYREAHLSIVQLIVLQMLTTKGGTMTPSEIAEWTQTERHNITTLVKRMQEYGLITAERSTVDRRVVNITLTDHGRKVLAQVLPAAQMVVDQVMLSINENDAALLEQLLKILSQNAQSGLDGISERA